jgi:hypothetical protein
VFQIFNDLLYDTYIKFPPRHNQSSKNVLIIEIHTKNIQPPEWIDFLENIQRHAPKQIIFTSWPPHATKQFYELALTYNNVIFGRQLQRTSGAPQTLYLEALPDAISDPPPPYGLVASPPVRHGIHRTQHAFLNFKGKQYAALEVLALQQQYRVSQLKHPYHINFKGGLDRLPKMTLDGPLTDIAIPELITGRHLLIGMNPDHSMPSLYTPLHPDDGRVSLLDYQGLALDTLLSNQVMIEPGKTMLLTLMLTLLVLNLFLYQWLNIRLASWLTLGIMGAYIFLGWVVFSYTSRWLPTSEMLVMQIGTFLLVFREKAVVREYALGRMLLDISTQTQERATAPNFLTSHEHWAQVVGMLSQMLDLNRLILFERVSRDHRVKEIIAWQCSMEDIYERRRDFHRHPYSTAIQQRKLLQIDDRPFLKPPSMPEDQYLMPLIFSGEIYGFWVFGIDPNKADDIPQFEVVIEEFGNQIATLLYRRQQWMLRSQVEDGNRLQKYLQIEGGERTYLDLNKSLTLMTQHLGRFENVFSHLSTATIVYNLFGDLIHINKRMVDLLKAAHLTPYNMNLSRLMVSLCSIHDREAKEYLRRIAFEKTYISLPARLPNHTEQHYVLHLHPIIQNDEESLKAPEEIQPFHMTGILCELVDITDIQQVHDFKIQIIEKIHNEIQGDLKSFTTAFHKIEKEYHISDTARDILVPMKNAIDNLIVIIDNMYKFLHVKNNHYKQGIYPINFQDILASSVRTFKLPLDKSIQIETIYLEENILAYASPTQFKHAIQTILDLLVSDAIDNTQITVEVRNDMDEILCILSNTGFGMPNAHLQNYVFGSSEIDSASFMKLRQLITEVRRWAATLEATSELGVGLKFCLKLKAFL